MMIPLDQQLVAHRGFMELYPENSWIGIKAAIEQGAKWIECDIQMYKPGHFILLHDADFERTTDTALSVFGLTEQQLQTISVHEPQRLGERYAPESVLTLEELLNRITTAPQARVMVEIKEESLDYWGIEQVMQPLLGILQAYRSQCVLISFSLKALQYAKAHSNLVFGWVLRQYDQKSLDQAISLKPQFLICNHLKMPKNKRPADGPWQWMIYDITEPTLVKQWIKWGIDLIETRDIGTLIHHPALTGDGLL